MCLAYQGFEFKSFCFEDLLLPNAECNCHKLQGKKSHEHDAVSCE